MPPLPSTDFPKYALYLRLLRIKHIAPRTAHLRQQNVRSQQSVKYALRFTRQRCTVPKYASTQVVLVTHVHPRNLADARTMHAFEQRGKQNPLVQREPVLERGHGQALQVPDDA
jgi:hypothetical protein